MPPKGKARATTAAHSKTVDAIREQKKMAQATLKQLRGAIKQELTNKTHTRMQIISVGS
jgi:ribosomal protein L9